MKRNSLATGLSRALVCAALMPASLPAFAQDAPGDAPASLAPTANASMGAMVAKDLDTVVVQGEIAYRDRTNDIEPTLVYDLEYFQRFEPSTVGDMLKRVPSVVFVSDVLEYDAVQLRGLSAAYTQVLVNGKKVPGAGDDRSFWVDRIPAELVERVEVLRSNSANRSGDAVAGAVNIILRDAYDFDGSYIRLGAMHYDDGEIQPTFAAVTSGEALGGRLLAGINVQDRYNPKIKRSDRFESPDGDFVDAEDQTDTRDGKDYSANLSYTADIGESGRLSLDGFYVRTDRDQVEVSTEYNARRPEDATEIANVPGLTRIDQDNWGIGAEYRFDMAGGRTEIDLDHARFQDRSTESEEEIAYEDGEWDGHEAEALDIDASDTETSLKIAHSRPLGAASMEFGVDLRSKDRDSTHTYYEFEADDEADPVVYELDAIVRSRIEETRIDPYLMFTGDAGPMAWEAGLRYETTRSDIEGDDGRASNDYDELLPSLHLKWDLGEASRIQLSLARSLRRPAFNELTPALLQEEFGDNDFLGNPLLDPETANGIDLGFEHRLGKRGVVGVNLFYRDIQDLIETVNTGEPNETAFDDYADDIADYMDENGVSEDEALAAVPFDPDSFIYTARNVGDGKAWGVELDLSTPLTAIGLPNTGVFVNYSWLDSEVEDELGTRRFNNQAEYVYNVGFIQDLPAWGASFGASYRKQGEAFMRVLAEEVRTTYDGDLEVFVEKRFGDNISVRLSGTNLLDAYKREYFDKFDNLADQLDRDYDEYELEAEHAGPRYQLVMRWAF
ncbi:TonB-dependent receptor plug domain-containing protein [Marilutibacter aestuarii]|uniref:TonB-dependent receptor n=1 Tax=Marilutibacter aestuarii TaxID=1706195 RepID=A0A508A452_9GAMM|nr:TonB-dependent receptor [Lysobacter aestuarii]TQD43531.1 TonB-dependent receptor [Lysobacter aestuarii]